MDWKVIDGVEGENDVPVMERSGNHLNTSNVKCFIDIRVRFFLPAISKCSVITFCC